PGVTPCPGILATPGPMSAAPVPVDFQPVQGIIGPVQVSVQWTPAAPPTDQRLTINTTCGGFTSAEQQVIAHAFSNETVTVTSLTIEGASATTGELIDIPLNGSFVDGTGGSELGT